MDKQLLKAYIRTIVEEEVQRILPELLSEAVSQIKQLSENTVPSKKPSPRFNREKMAQLLNVSFDGDTLRADTRSLNTPATNIPKDADPDVVKAITRDYSDLMKKMGLSK